MQVTSWVNRVNAPPEDEHMPVDREAYLADMLYQMRHHKAQGVRKDLLFKKQIFAADDAHIQEARFHELCYLQVTSFIRCFVNPFHQTTILRQDIANTTPRNCSSRWLIDSVVASLYSFRVVASC